MRTFIWQILHNHKWFFYSKLWVSCHVKTDIFYANVNKSVSMCITFMSNPWNFHLYVIRWLEEHTIGKNWEWKLWDIVQDWLTRNMHLKLTFVLFLLVHEGGEALCRGIKRCWEAGRNDPVSLQEAEALCQALKPEWN